MSKPNTTCANCGKLIYAAPSRQKRVKHVTCSHECKWALLGVEYVSCSICGTQIYRSPTAKETFEHFFCSSDCRAVGYERGIGTNTPKPENILTCDECGKTFYRPAANYRRGEHVFCSRDCASQFRRQRIKVECTLCGEGFVRRPSELVSEKGRVFCSRKHYWTWRLGRRGINDLEQEFLQTYPQFRYVGDGKLWVEHENGRANPDFILPGTNIVVELFGDYWHKEYEVERRITQLKDVGLDATIIWESDVEENPDEVKATVEAMLRRAEAQQITTEPLQCDRCGAELFNFPTDVRPDASYFCKQCIAEIQDEEGERVPRKKPNAECVECGEPLYRQPSHVRAGKTFYCSQECINVKEARLRKEREANREPNTVCAYCGAEFFRQSAWKKRHDKQYCDRACYLAQVRGAEPGEGQV